MTREAAREKLNKIIEAKRSLVGNAGRSRTAVVSWFRSALLPFQKANAHLRRQWFSLKQAHKTFKRVSEPTPPPVFPPISPAQDFVELLFQRSVDPRLLALLKLRTASRLGCETSIQQHAQMCYAQGWSQGQVIAIHNGTPHPTFSEWENLLLRYADDITRTPTDVDLKLSKDLRLFFSADQIMEITTAICYENFRTRLKNALGLEGKAVEEEAAEAKPKFPGYSDGVHDQQSEALHTAQRYRA